MRAESGPDPDRSSVKSLRKALGVLDIVAAADRPLAIAEIAVCAGIARPTAYRIVQTLLAEDYLEQNPIDGRISIGLATLPLAANTLDHNRMRLEALPYLQDLANKTGERVNLGILYRNHVLYLAGVEKPSLPTIYTRFGKLAPAHSSALGKAILANLPDVARQELLRLEPLTAQTPNTITDPTAFAREMKEIRRQGYAVDRGENVLGTYCVAAPIFDSQFGPVGAIGVSSRGLEPILAGVDHIRHTAEIITHLL